MKLSQKFKHYKRHRQNKKLYDSVEVVYHLGIRMEMPESYQNMFTMYVSPLMYEVMRVNHGHIPTNITCSSIIKEKDRFITTTRGWIDMPNVDLPLLNTDIKPVYLGVDIGLRPSVSAPVPNSITVKEV